MSEGPSTVCHTTMARDVEVDLEADAEAPRARLSFPCDRRLAERVEELARRNGVPPEEALRQLVELGLEEVSSDASC